MFGYINKNPEKKALVEQMGFGVFSHLPKKNLNQRLLKQMFDRYDIYDNTIYSDAGAVKITTRKIGDALGLCSKALTPIFDLETTSSRNWALHVHDFLLQELKKSKQKDHVAIHGYVYVLMIIYFHETHFGEGSKDEKAHSPWIAYWKGETLKKRLRKERRHEAGLLKTWEMIAKKDSLRKKKTTIGEPSSGNDSDAGSESYESSSSSSDSETSNSSESEHSDHEEPPTPPQQEIRSKKKNDHPIVGSNEPVNITQESVASAGVLQPENDHLNEINDVRVNVEDAEVEGPHVMDDSVLEDPQLEPLIVIIPIELEKQSGMATQCLEKDSEVEPEPVNTQILVQFPFSISVQVPPLQPDQHSARTTEDPGEHIEVEPELVTTQSHLEPELTLKPWLQPEAGTNEAETKSAEEVITNVLLSINQDEGQTR
ncbi:hypothetical protein PIB30_001655 [Stylosanthes scabra]|uniref:Uncharacterized protein n=1 Tax=Stylosanthes scabra TaxID=79078 RepID=A0ABU6T2K9_9FABA|nr:hypothetical protein [Stylosanthes scabra]